MEYDKSEYIPERDAGYSETQSALDKDIQDGAWKGLSNIAAYTAYSRQQRIFLAYQAVSNKLFHLVSENLLSESDDHERETFLAELKDSRIIQDILLNCLLWDQKGQLEEYMVPKEVWNLIK
ncbi:MAG TPA: hypothetical protein VLG12_08770 [Candidatus Saccharimonadales bacterium]|nr:hypothetical protein [Candidatus Saccharimonadales bacterium]